MDHTHYSYSPQINRTNWCKTPQVGVVAYSILFLEHWDFVAADDARKDPRMLGEFGSFNPDYRSWTQREYGLRVGIFRVIDALKEAGICPVIAANAKAIERLPQLVKTFNEWGCEWLAHGIASNDMMHSQMSVGAQNEYIASSIKAIQKYTGHTPRGWMSQDWGTSTDTFELLAKHAIEYTLDWNNDDQPYALNARHAITQQQLVAIAYASEWDDVQCQWLRNVLPTNHAQLCFKALQQLRDESLKFEQPRVFGLGIHPWLWGMPNRISYLKKMLHQFKELQHIQWMHTSDIFQLFQHSTKKT